MQFTHYFCKVTWKLPLRQLAFVIGDALRTEKLPQ